MKLPSGKDVPFRRPTYGEIKEARALLRSTGDKDAFYDHTFACTTGLSAQDIGQLDAADGLALERAIDECLIPRKEEDEAPFDPSSSPSS